MLKIKDLRAGYGELKILKGVDLEVNENEVVALIGPNGAGKSTVIKSVYSIADQYSGAIVFNNKNISKLKTHQLLSRRVSYMPQGRIVFDHLTVQENLEIACNHIRNSDIIKQRLEEVYQKFPILKERRKQQAFALSGGQRQMLAIGRSLMQKPRLLLMDEPSLGLSPKLQQEIFAIIEKLRDEGLAILIVEQNAKKAIEMADRTYLLEDGKIALVGGKEIIHNKKIKKVYLGGE
ncbi:MAG: ABC transporter ATP-binding protein [archaeon]|nr:ABC transporter ATP-binding protein [Nanoarchaeota archaeon]